MSEDERRYEIVFAGVGGQGILTITDMICNTAIWEGWRVRGSETHGMAQRGGTIVSNIRLGKGPMGYPWSSLIAEREADLLISLEPAEALRYAKYVKPTGAIVTNIYSVAPPSLTVTKAEYPSLEDIMQAIKDYTSNIIAFDAIKLAEELNAVRSTNVIMLGAAAAIPEFPLPEAALLKAIEYQLPQKVHEINKKAFQSGKNAALQQLK
jgi:indolepyruvate ferredoxin oxidoreductase beta subunit